MVRSARTNRRFRAVRATRCGWIGRFRPNDRSDRDEEHDDWTCRDMDVAAIEHRRAQRAST